jgi:ketosteroid isomerase-like protein
MSQENVELVRQGTARWRAGDYDALLEFLISSSAPEIELYSRFGGFSGEPYRGHDGVRAWVADIQENFERFEPWLDEARAVGDDRVVASGGIRFRARESGVDMAEQMGWVYEFRNGLVRRMMFYGSWSEALEAVGLRE